MLTPCLDYLFNWESRLVMSADAALGVALLNEVYWIKAVYKQLYLYFLTHPILDHSESQALLAGYECGPTCEGEKGRHLTGVLLGVMESLGSGEAAMRRRLWREMMEGGVVPRGEMGISSPRLLLLSSCRVLPSRRNWSSSGPETGLWLSSGRSKVTSARLHQLSMS